MNNETTTAAVIVAQLGYRVMMMLGAAQIVDVGNGVQFKIGKNAKKVTKIRIILDAATDTYTVEFWKIRGLDAVKLNEVEGVHVDVLHATIETHTGLYTSLGTMGRVGS